VLIPSASICSLLPETLILFIVLAGIRAVDDLVTIEVSNATNKVAEQALREFQVLRHGERRLGLEHIEILLIETLLDVVDLLGHVVGREGHLAALRLVDDVEFECTFEDLLHHMHVARTRAVLDRVGQPWWRHLLGSIFLDESIDGGLQRPEQHGYKEISSGPAQTVGP
jgi:hypothetical protein